MTGGVLAAVCISVVLTIASCLAIALVVALRVRHQLHKKQLLNEAEKREANIVRHGYGISVDNSKQHVIIHKPSTHGWGALATYDTLRRHHPAFSNGEDPEKGTCTVTDQDQPSPAITEPPTEPPRLARLAVFRRKRISQPPTIDRAFRVQTRANTLRSTAYLARRQLVYGGEGFNFRFPRRRSSRSSSTRSATLSEDGTILSSGDTMNSLLRKTSTATIKRIRSQGSDLGQQAVQSDLPMQPFPSRATSCKDLEADIPPMPTEPFDVFVQNSFLESNGRGSEDSPTQNDSTSSLPDCERMYDLLAT